MSEFIAQPSDYDYEHYRTHNANLRSLEYCVDSSRVTYNDIMSGTYTYLRSEFELTPEAAQRYMADPESLGGLLPGRREYSDSPQKAKEQYKLAFYHEIVPLFEAMKEPQVVDHWLPLAYGFVLLQDRDSLRDNLSPVFDMAGILHDDVVDRVYSGAVDDAVKLGMTEELAYSLQRRLSVSEQYGVVTHDEAEQLMRDYQTRLADVSPL